MTLIEFLKEARNAGKWHTENESPMSDKDSLRFVRCENGWCPIVAVSNARRKEIGLPLYIGNWEYRDAGEWLGLDFEDVSMIVGSSDTTLQDLSDTVEVVLLAEDEVL